MSKVEESLKDSLKKYIVQFDKTLYLSDHKTVRQKNPIIIIIVEYYN